MTKNQPYLPHERADDSLLRSVDAALKVTQGSFLAAAKLLDLEPQKFRNIVNWNRSLKAKWGKKRGGQRRLGLCLNPPAQFILNPAPTKCLLTSVEPKRPELLRDAKRMIMRHLSPDQIDELTIWLNGLRDLFGKRKSQRTAVLEEFRKSEGC